MLGVFLCTVDASVVTELRTTTDSADNAFFAVSMDYEPEQVSRQLLHYACPNLGQDKFDFWSRLELEQCAKVQHSIDAKAACASERALRFHKVGLAAQKRTLSAMIAEAKSELEDGQDLPAATEAKLLQRSRSVPVEFTPEEKAYVAESKKVASSTRLPDLAGSVYLSIEELFTKVCLSAVRRQTAVCQTSSLRVADCRHPVLQRAERARASPRP